MLIAASKTMWQSEQESTCRLISFATDGESRPSKYQQIKWIVSRQLMTAVPPWPRADTRPPISSAFDSPNSTRDAKDSNCLDINGLKDLGRTRAETDGESGEKITQLLQHLCEDCSLRSLSASVLRSSLAKPLFAFRVAGEC